MQPLRVATRGSALARWQAERVVTLLGGDAELVIITTTGDTRNDTPIHSMGGTGVFVKEVQQAVLDGRADIAVHSAKDLPASAAPEGLVFAAVPERADPRDALVGSTLDALPAGALIGTGSVRRRAQLAALRPDLTFAELRGNIPTRLEKAAGFDAIVVAVAALDRLGLRRPGDRRTRPVGDAADGRAGRARRRVPRRRRGDTSSARVHRRRERAPTGRCRAGIPRRTRRWLQPAVRGARARRRRRAHRSRRCSRPRMVASCSGRRDTGPIPSSSAPRRPTTCWSRAGVSSSTREWRRDRLPRGCRTGRSRSPHGARLRGAHQCRRRGVRPARIADPARSGARGRGADLRRQGAGAAST